MTLGTWVVILLLIAANALYVAAEFAAVGVRRSRLQQRAEAGQARAARVLHVVQDTSRLDRHIATCQIGITLSSLLLGAYGQLALAPDLADLLAARTGLAAAGALGVAATVVLVVLTILQVVLGELVPKSLALQFPTRTAIWTFPPVHASSRVLAPFLWLLNGSALALLRGLRLPAGSHHHVHDPQEIAALVAESRDGGLLEAEEHDRLQAALRLRRTPARDLMVPLDRVVCVPEDIGFEALVERVAEAPFTRLPTYRGDVANVTGFLHTKDVFLKAATEASARPLVRPILRVAASTPGDRLLETLRSNRAQIALVTEGGQAAGIVAFEDVLARVLGPAAPAPQEGRGGA